MEVIARLGDFVWYGRLRRLDDCSLGMRIQEDSSGSECVWISIGGDFCGLHSVW